MAAASFDTFDATLSTPLEKVIKALEEVVQSGDMEVVSKESVGDGCGTGLGEEERIWEIPNESFALF